MKHRGTYPDDWPAIAQATKSAAGWRCVRCDHAHEPKTGYCLTVHHLSGDKADVRWFNLAALCQRCHLAIQGKVDLDRPWIFEHSEWFWPYVAGHYAWHYLGEELSREAVLDRLPELLGLEAQWVLGSPPIALEAAP